MGFALGWWPPAGCLSRQRGDTSKCVFLISKMSISQLLFSKLHAFFLPSTRTCHYTSLGKKLSEGQACLCTTKLPLQLCLLSPWTSLLWQCVYKLGSLQAPFCALVFPRPSFLGLSCFLYCIGNISLAMKVFQSIYKHALNDPFKIALCAHLSPAATSPFVPLSKTALIGSLCLLSALPYFHLTFFTEWWNLRAYRKRQNLMNTHTQPALYNLHLSQYFAYLIFLTENRFTGKHSVLCLSFHHHAFHHKCNLPFLLLLYITVYVSIHFTDIWVWILYITWQYVACSATLQVGCTECTFSAL